MQSGIELIPYAKFLGLEVRREKEGLLCVLPFREEIIGNRLLPAIHGGVVGAFLELTAFAVLLDEAEAERVPKPINFTIDYLRSAKPRDVYGSAEIVKHGRRIANVRVVAWQDDPDSEQGERRTVSAGIGNFRL